METIKEEIVDAAGKIVTEAGIDFLTTENLATKMGVDSKTLHNHFKSDAAILNFLLITLKREIKILITDAESSNKSPADELELLFENIFNLFITKPYYLTIVVSVEEGKMGNRTKTRLKSIKKVISIYLTKIIDKGKKEEIFKTKRSPNTLVDNILVSFRSFMDQENMMNKWIRDLKMIRENPDNL